MAVLHHLDAMALPVVSYAPYCQSRRLQRDAVCHANVMQEIREHIHKLGAYHTKVHHDLVETLDPPLIDRMPKIRYEQMIERVPMEECKLLHIPQDVPEEFMQNVHSGNVYEIMELQEAPLYALRALELGRLSIQDFASILLFWTGYQEPKSERLWSSIALIREDVSATFRSSSLWCAYCPSMPNRHLTQEQEELFFARMDQCSLLQQQMVYCYLKARSTEEDIINRISKVGVSILCRIDDMRWMVPSFVAMQIFLEVLVGDQAVRVRPVLGMSTLDDIFYNGCTNTRDMGIPFPGISLSKKADGYLAPGVQFAIHDFYHSIVTSKAPMQDKHFLLRMSSLARQLGMSMQKDRKKESLLLRRFSVRLGDLDIYQTVFENRIYCEDVLQRWKTPYVWMNQYYAEYAHRAQKEFDVLGLFQEFVQAISWQDLQLIDVEAMKNWNAYWSLYHFKQELDEHDRICGYPVSQKFVEYLEEALACSFKHHTLQQALEAAYHKLYGVLDRYNTWYFVLQRFAGHVEINVHEQAKNLTQSTSEDGLLEIVRKRQQECQTREIRSLPFLVILPSQHV